MKKITLTALVFIVFFLNSFAQKNYFDWRPYYIGASSYPVRGDGLVCDDEGDVFYTNTGNYIQVVKTDGTTTELTYYNFSKVKQGSPLIKGGWRTFYFGENGRLYSFYKLNGELKSNWVNTSFPVGRGKGLVYADDTKTIFYADFSSNLVVCEYHNSYNSYKRILLPEKIHAKCNMAYGQGRLYFTSIFGNIFEVYKSGSSWIVNKISTLYSSRGDALTYTKNGALLFPEINNGSIVMIDRLSTENRTRNVGSNSVRTQIGVNFIESKIWGGITYVGIDGMFHTFYWDGNYWINNVIVAKENSTGKIRNPGNDKMIYFNSSEIFYTPVYSNSIFKIRPRINEDTYPFIYLKGNDFMDKGEKFYPLVMNYTVCLAHQKDDKKQIWAIPDHQTYIDFLQFFYNIANSKENGLNAIERDFNSISELGFNTIRLIGLSVVNINSLISLRVQQYWDAPNERLKPGNTTLMGAENADFRDRYISIINEILNLAENHNLKVIIHTGDGGMCIPDKYSEYLSFLSAQLDFNSNILAYDIYNEPNAAISDLPCNAPDKNSINQMSCDWVEAIEGNDMRHLITIGNSGSSDGLMNFDPTLLPVDFLSFHIYPFGYQYNRLRNNLRWIRENFRKPWIIGETGFSAVKDGEICVSYPMSQWGTETEQKLWTEQSIKEVMGSGGKGYSYWLLRDKKPNDTSSERAMGLVTICTPTTDNINYNFNDLDKKSVADFLFLSKPDLLQNQSQSYIIPYSDNDYYNFIPNAYFYYTGTLLNDDAKPISGAKIYLQSRENTYSTISKIDGKFYISYPGPLTNISMQISGPGTEKIVLYSHSLSHFSNPLYNNIILYSIQPCKRSYTEFLYKNDESEKEIIKLNKNSQFQSEINNNSIEFNHTEIFPNPSDGYITIVSNQNIPVIVKIYNINGALVYSKRHFINEKFYIGNLQKGFYLVKIEEKENIFFHKLLLN